MEILVAKERSLCRSCTLLRTRLRPSKASLARYVAVSSLVPDLHPDDQSSDLCGSPFPLMLLVRLKNSKAVFTVNELFL